MKKPAFCYKYVERLSKSKSLGAFFEKSVIDILKWRPWFLLNQNFENFCPRAARHYKFSLRQKKHKHTNAHIHKDKNTLSIESKVCFCHGAFGLHYKFSLQQKYTNTQMHIYRNTQIHIYTYIHKHTNTLSMESKVCFCLGASSLRYKFSLQLSEQLVSPKCTRQT